MGRVARARPVIGVWGPLIFVVGLGGAVSSAFAQPLPQQEQEAEARELYHYGDRLYSEGRYAEAVRAFRQAYELSKRPALLFNIANALERDGLWQDARSALEQYLPHASEDRRFSVEERIANLSRKIETQRAKEKALEAQKQSKQPAEAPRVVPQASRDLVLHPPPTSKDTTHTNHGPWIVAIGGGALAAGIGLAIAASVERRSGRDKCVDLEGSLICRTDAEAPINREREFAIGADIAFGTGLIVSAIGTYFWIRHARRPEASDKRVHVAPAVGRGNASIVVDGNF